MKQKLLIGSTISRGIGIGTPFVIDKSEGESIKKQTFSHSAEKEVLRYQKAVNLSILDVESLQKQLIHEKAFEGIAVLETHKQMLKDPLITDLVEEEILRSKRNSLIVLEDFLGQYRERFTKLVDPILQERFKDVQDVATRVKNHLMNRERLKFDQFPQSVVIFAKELTPTEVAEMRPDQVAAIVTTEGTLTSHAAIIAKAKGIPYVANIPFAKESVSLSSKVIVDGRKGEVILYPTTNALEQYETLQKELMAYKETLQLAEFKPITKDGFEIKLALNIDSQSQVSENLSRNSSGVGLFRTEFLLKKDRPLLGEEEQYQIYRDLLIRFGQKPVVIRLFDFGGDKEMPGFEFSKELNPSLGLRAIRLLLKEQRLFRTQLRAIFRAAVYGNVRLLLPMITTIDEIKQVKETIEEIKNQLKAEGETYSEEVPIGCMVEVPSAALMTDLLAQKVDFLSIGTNDLSQFVMGADRTNPTVSHLYTSHHPSVLRLIDFVVQEANKRQVPLSICGEIAADPRFTTLLLGLGLRELSVAGTNVFQIQNVIRRIDLKEASELAKKALMLSEATEVEALAFEFYKEHFPDDHSY